MGLDDPWCARLAEMQLISTGDAIETDSMMVPLAISS
jgi:hypothetical protein